MNDSHELIFKFPKGCLQNGTAVAKQTEKQKHSFYIFFNLFTHGLYILTQFLKLSIFLYLIPNYEKLPARFNFKF